ncbi:MAG TPA: alpha/beta hydrolase-fold protein, partial [Thermomicrobiaceae bacterium]|nr:alpha/beta hydrolase-fold protein [Thermomicrobiaceae bacterium]
MIRPRRAVAAALVVLACLIAAPAVAARAPIAGGAFGATWARTDHPVANGTVARTWMWGPAADTPALDELYAGAPGGQRLVQYFDKSRMERTNPGGDPSSPWYVTNGLLAEELVTGRLQLGASTFQQHAPAQVNVAGDLNDRNGPTYASFSGLRSYQAIPDGWTLIQTVDRAGQVGADPSLARYAVRAAEHVRVPGIDHQIASVFWDFMRSSGLVEQQGQYAAAPLFPNSFYATGYPLTEAYWTHVLVGGTPRLVLVQVFERRVMTYTPDNPEGWQVEAGNVGQHYYAWRYTQLGQSPVSDASLHGDWQLPGIPGGLGLGCQPGAPSDYRTCLYRDTHGLTMTFYLYLPSHFDAAQRYPLVLLLHGGGERYDPNRSAQANRDVLLSDPYAAVWGPGIDTPYSPTVQQTWPSVVVVPQVVVGQSFVSVPSNTGSYRLPPQPTDALRLTKEIVDALQQQVPQIDAKRRYVTGLSMGGYGAWELLERYPGYFAAAAPICGGGDPAQAAPLAQLPIWAFQSADDPIVPVQATRDMIAAIEAAGGSPRYT